MIYAITENIIEFVRADFQSNWWRATLEVVGMTASIVTALMIAATTPNPPMLLCYTTWMLASSTLCISSWHRGSIGLTTTYAAFLIIDGVGLLRTLAS